MGYLLDTNIISAWARRSHPALMARMLACTPSMLIVEVDAEVVAHNVRTVVRANSKTELLGWDFCRLVFFCVIAKYRDAADKYVAHEHLRHRAYGKAG